MEDQDGQQLLERVRAAQEELGSGSVEDALEQVTPLLGLTSSGVTDPSFLGRLPADKQALIEAFCYARVTAILAFETIGAAEAVPRIRELAAEARDVAGRGTSGWKVQCAAAEMLSRCGDGQGAADAVAAAARSAPEDEPYVERLTASIRSMFPNRQ